MQASFQITGKIMSRTTEKKWVARWLVTHGKSNWLLSAYVPVWFKVPVLVQHLTMSPPQILRVLSTVKIIQLNMLTTLISSFLQIRATQVLKNCRTLKIWPLPTICSSISRNQKRSCSEPKDVADKIWNFLFFAGIYKELKWLLSLEFVSMTH